MRGPTKSSGRTGRLENETEQADWMIREFKTLPCASDASSQPHDHRCCPYYHSESDRRRPVVGVNGLLTYLGEPCGDQFDDRRTCLHGDACSLCHSSAELLYHPDFFRKRLCHQARRCPRAAFCAFAHSRNELLVPHFSETEELSPGEDFVAYRFKTQWCPIGGPHDWEACVYAHTYRDWRRIPILGYTSHPCRRWANSIAHGSPELAYMERCPYGVACPMAHGAKEQLYHPQFYKTSPCSDSSCRRGPLCAFTHGEADIRRLPAEEPARVERRPIPQAEELLKQYQPTFATPPAYHALDESPRGGAGSPRRARNRRARGRGQAADNREVPCRSGEASPQSPMVAHQMPEGAAAVIYAPFPPYYWVPLSGPCTQQLQMDATRTGLVGSVAWSEGGSPVMMMPQQMSPQSSPLHRAPVSSPAAPVSMTSFMMPVHGGASPTGEAMPVVDFSTIKKKFNCKHGSGWRTPSPFGSPPLSSAPTAASSPRTAEGAGSTAGSGGTSEQATWG